MKRTPGYLLAAFVLILAASNTLSAQIKSGWSVVPLPIVSYNSDLGFNIGAQCDIFSYGTDPSIFPYYHHRFHTEASYFTGGEMRFKADYDSGELIPGVRTNIVAAYMKSPLSCFYGFNGDVETYDRERDCKGTYADYSYNRGEAQVTALFQGRITDHLQWIAGGCWLNYAASEVNFKDYDASTSIYTRYVKSGIIDPGEADGGNVFEVRGGFSFDTRDFESDPRKGIWADVSLNAGSSLNRLEEFGNPYYYLKAAAHLRGYWSPKDWVTLAGHVAYQGLLSGKQPWYTLNNIYSNDVNKNLCSGLGGMYTVRGIMAGRLLGNGYAWFNAETRFRAFNFNLWKQQIGIGFNAFCDGGIITQAYRLEEMSKAYGTSVSDLDKLAKKMHIAPGAGVQLTINVNTLMTVEFAKSVEANDGPLCVAIYMHYLF